MEHSEKISAEIEPFFSKGRNAATEMQKLGFKIFHVGETISVEGRKSLWKKIFKTKFVRKSKVGPHGIYFKAIEGSTEVPENLSDLISSVYFVEPPELY